MPLFTPLCTLLLRAEVDIGKEDEVKFPVRFAVSLDISVDTDLVKETTHTWDTLKPDKLHPQVCFSTKEEFLECQEEFGKISVMIAIASLS